MKGFIAIFLCSCTLFAYCQDYTPVDRKEIQKAVTDPALDTYYPRLIKKYEQFDSSLNGEQYRLLYYGFAFQKGYTGYNDNRSQSIKESIRNKKYSEAIKTCDSVLEVIPVSLTINYLKGLCLFYKDPGDSIWVKYKDRYYNLVEAILSSGNGIECKTAFKTIFVADEYEIIYKVFDIKVFSGQVLKQPCDLLRIKGTDKFNHDEIYFDTSETLEALEKSL
ncbi:MAG TPA: DUF4919 domain-containing protein, partial [Chitinophagaceae bacterium]|nr:DUF4919 domain-containing protein [Chitinophagaceae bacterium]